MISFGTERVLGTRYGPNVPLSFDGGLVHWNEANWDVHGFYLRPVEVAPDPLDNLSSWTSKQSGPVREVVFLVSYSQFQPGSFIKETGPSETIHFVAIEAFSNSKAASFAIPKGHPVKMRAPYYRYLFDQRIAASRTFQDRSQHTTPRSGSYYPWELLF